MEKLLCSCGGVNSPNHPIGEGNCFREEATGNLIPTNFRKEKWFDSWKEAYEVCDVGDYDITVWTLINQRGYHQHPDGRWSLPKSHDSVISIGENW